MLMWLLPYATLHHLILWFLLSRLIQIHVFWTINSQQFTLVFRLSSVIFVQRFFWVVVWTEWSVHAVFESPSLLFLQSLAFTRRHFFRMGRCGFKRFSFLGSQKFCHFNIFNQIIYFFFNVLSLTISNLTVVPNCLLIDSWFTLTLRHIMQRHVPQSSYFGL